MTGQDLRDLATASNVNPYFLGYALSTGAASVEAALERDGNAAGFLCWNDERWTQQAAREGIPRHSESRRGLGVGQRDGAADRHCDLIAECVTAFDWSWPR